MSEATEKFIRAFEALKTEINRRAGEPKAFDTLLDRAAQRDGLVWKNRERIRYIKDIRNLLQHPRNARPARPFEITDEFQREVEGILAYLIDPPCAKDLGVSRANLTTAALSDRIGDLADMMKQKGFSHLPIFDAKGTVIGVFNEAAVFGHLWDEEEKIVGRGMQVADILESCRLNAGHTETFDFVQPPTPTDALVDRFVSVGNHTRVGAIFVTSSGKATEPIQRMITPWDVLAGFETERRRR